MDGGREIVREVEAEAGETTAARGPWQGLGTTGGGLVAGGDSMEGDGSSRVMEWATAVAGATVTLGQGAERDGRRQPSSDSMDSGEGGGIGGNGGLGPILERPEKAEDRHQLTEGRGESEHLWAVQKRPKPENWSSMSKSQKRRWYSHQLD